MRDGWDQEASGGSGSQWATEGCIVCGGGISDRFLTAAHSSRSEDETSDRSGAVMLASLTALSGAIVGFVLAGQFQAATLVFFALIAGGVLGWVLRGMSK